MIPQSLPSVPRPSLLWPPLRLWGWVLYVGLLLAAVPDFFVDYWFFQSLGRASIFWTNLSAQLGLFTAGGLLFTAAVYVPLRLHTRKTEVGPAAVHLSLWIGIFAGWLLARHYLDYLLAVHSGPFNARDPLFGNDIGWYVFRLPAVQIALDFFIGLALVGAVS